jgi:hypothetical protein
MVGLSIRCGESIEHQGIAPHARIGSGGIPKAGKEEISAEIKPPPSPCASRPTDCAKGGTGPCQRSGGINQDRATGNAGLTGAGSSAGTGQIIDPLSRISV